MVGLIVAILIIFSLRLFWPSTQSGMSEVSENEQPEISEENGSLSEKLNISDDSLAEDERTRLMTAEYEILVQARKELKRHLARLRHDMWGLKFASEKAKKMSTSVMGASRLLKNPHMLGAFSNVEGIKDEIAKINFAEKSLQQVNEIIEASKNNSEESS